VVSGVLAGRTLTTISAGSSHTCALDAEGLAFCWGNGFAGRLGTANSTSTRVPVAVDTTGTLLGRPLSDIATGPGDTLAIAEGPALPTAPEAPTGVTGSAGDHQATVTWVPGPDGGATITQYTGVSGPGNRRCVSSSTSCVVTGLGNKREYAFVVRATNRIGTSAASAASPVVMPVGPPPAPKRPIVTLLKVRLSETRTVLR
jgi:hypothetical protein